MSAPAPWVRVGRGARRRRDDLRGRLRTATRRDDAEALLARLEQVEEAAREHLLLEDRLAAELDQLERLLLGLADRTE